MLYLVSTPNLTGIEYVKASQYKAFDKFIKISELSKPECYMFDLKS